MDTGHFREEYGYGRLVIKGGTWMSVGRIDFLHEDWETVDIYRRNSSGQSGLGEEDWSLVKVGDGIRCSIVRLGRGVVGGVYGSERGVAGEGVRWVYGIYFHAGVDIKEEDIVEDVRGSRYRVIGVSDEGTHVEGWIEYMGSGVI